MSPLSTKQKAQALDIVIGSCMAYSMPLGAMTLSDVSKCDAIKLNICKRMYKLPSSTPSAMIHQDRERAGLGLTSMHVMYAKLTCTYLAKALNDKGPLVFVTSPMLMLQKVIIAQEKVEARDPQPGKEKEQKKHGRQHRVQGKARPR